MIYQAKYGDRLTARIANFSDDEKTGVRVEFQLNDHPEARRDQNRRARRDDGRIHRLQSERRRQSWRDRDRRRQFPFDNRFNFTLRRAEQMKALVIETATRGREEFLFAQRADHRRKPAVQPGGQNGRLGQPGGPRRLSRNHPQRRAGQSGDGSSVDQIRGGRRRAGHRYRPTPNRPRSIRSSKISRPPGSKKRFGLPAAEAAITW